MSRTTALLTPRGLTGGSTTALLAPRGLIGDGGEEGTVFICLHGRLEEIPTLGGELVAVPTLGGGLESC